MAKFKDGDIVRHVRTGNRYRVIFAPDRNQAKINGEWVSAYSYRQECNHAGPIYTRAKFDFETKFEAVE
jgi:hypothetical protein